MPASAYPFQTRHRNQTRYNATPTTAPSKHTLGAEYLIPDTNNTTQRWIRVKEVLNATGSTLSANQAVRYGAATHGWSVSALASSITDADFAGWVWEGYTGTVASNDVFMLVIEGPANREGQTDDTIPQIQDFMRNTLATHGLTDDFYEYTTDDSGWTTVASDSGTVAIQDGLGGQILISASDGSVVDNDETYIKGSAEGFIFTASKPIVMECRVKHTEANTDDGNLIIGIKDAVAADSILDDGAGPAASYSGVLFFKVDGGTVWQAECSVAGTQVTDTSVGTHASNTWEVLRFEWIPTSATSATCRFFKDGTLGATITHTYTSGTEMEACMGVKNGGANHEELVVDYFTCRQLR